MRLAQRYMEEVIWAFPDSTGMIPMHRGDAAALANEFGMDGDLMAFGRHVFLAAGEEPVLIGEARMMLDPATESM